MCKPLLFLLISALFAFSCNKVISSSLSSSGISETTPSEESTPVTLPVISLSINATVSEIEVGHSLTLIANVTGSAEKPVWSIEEKDPSSMDAEIDQNGVLNSGSVPGKVTVKASIEGISDEVIITVKEAPVSVTIDNSVKEVEIGETAQLSATRSNDEPITWSIVEKNPTSIDAVIDSETGLLTAGSIKGTVKILAECGSASDSLDIDIIDPVPHWIDNANFGYRDPSTGLGYYLGEEDYRDGLEATANYVKAFR